MDLLLRVFCLCSLLCLAALVSADLDPGGTVSGGQKCHPINERQAEHFERRRDGIWNVSVDQAFWLVCPIDLPLEPIDAVCPTLRVSNRSTGTAEINCVFREMGPDGAVLQAIANGPSIVEAGKVQFVNAYWWSCRIPVSLPYSFWSVSCLMPPETGVMQVFSLHFGVTEQE